MRVVIAYVSAGAGHRRCAEALYNYLRENQRNSEINLIDALEETHPLFKKLYTQGYIFLVNHAIWVWQFIFWITSIKGLLPFSRALNSLLIRAHTRKFAKFLIRQNPHFIVSTHFLPSDISAYLKRAGQVRSSLITVITDFAVHPFWIHNGTDTYVVASGFAKKQLVGSGIKEDKIQEFGIPLDAKFLIKYEKGLLCKKLNIDENKFTVLIVTGSFGVGPIEEIVDMLYRDAQFLVICANNKGLYARLKHKDYPGVRVFGFVDNMHEMMPASDVIITKPGGLTIAEVLAVGAAPIFISPIPGQEIDNIRVLARYGVGESCKRLEEIKNIILDYKAHPEKLSQIKQNIAAIKKPFAAKELCNAICQSGSGAGC